MDFDSYIMSTGYTNEEIGKINQTIVNVTSGIKSISQQNGNQLVFTLNDNTTITLTVTGLSSNDYTTLEKNKLGSIDSTLLNRFTYVNNQLLFDGKSIVNSTIDLSTYLKTVDADSKYESKDSTIVKDSSYVHTDNNYNNIEKTKVSSTYNHISDGNNPHNTNLSQLKDVITTNLTDKQVLSYDTAINKFINQNNIDEKVKINSASTSKYLGEWLDGTSIQNIGGKLVCKSLDGMDITLVELNRLSGLDKNIMDYLNAISNPMTVKAVVNTYADLSSISSPTDGNVVIVKTDETHDSKQWTYIYINSAWSSIAENTMNVRDFSVNKLDLTSEVKNQLPQTNIDMTDIVKTNDLANYLKVNDASSTYATINSVSGKVNTTDIIDNLTSADNTKPLSANQGSVIKSLIDTKAKIDDSVTSSTTDTYSIDKIKELISSGGSGENFEVVSSLPSSPNSGKIYILSSNFSLNYYDSSWHTLNEKQIIIGTSNTDTTKLWLDTTTTPILKWHNGTDWINISGSSSQIQSDWNQTDNTKSDYIKNKPTNLLNTNNIKAGNNITLDKSENNITINANMPNYTEHLTSEISAENGTGYYKNNLGNVGWFQLPIPIPSTSSIAQLEFNNLQSNIPQTQDFLSSLTNIKLLVQNYEFVSGTNKSDIINNFNSDIIINKTNNIISDSNGTKIEDSYIYNCNLTQNGYYETDIVENSFIEIYTIKDVI